jgi:alpha-beta hydrolase superfamily lysophospholipase
MFAGKFLNTIVVALCIVSNSTNAINWYDNLIFKDPSFSYEFIRTIGYSVSGGADIGESISTARSIPNGDITQWYAQWYLLGDRLYRLAENFKADHNDTSAQAAYFRASNYYRTASFYMDAPKLRSKAIDAWQRSRLSFLQAITDLPYIRTVRIPYGKTTLPGYFIQSKVNNAPLIIVNTGFDGTAEELYFETGLAAHKRGYHVLLIEGPGQGEMIKQQRLPFRYDWENVITPVIEFTNRLPNVDHNKIALMGISMGGYLAARAAAFEPRIKAVILNPGVYSMLESLNANLSNELINLAKTDPNKFNQIIQKEMQKDINANWFFNNAMWVFGANSPAAVLNALKPYNTISILKKIQCPALVVDSVSDSFMKNQPQQVYQQLASPKTLLVFGVQEAAQAHCQMGAIAISNEKVYNWLDKTFNWHPVIIN